MSIMTTMIVKLFYFKCSVCLSKRFFLLFLMLRKIAKRKSEHFHLKRSQKNFSCLRTKQVAILLVDGKNHADFIVLNQYRISFFFDLNFILFRVFLISFFVAEADIFLNLVFIFEQK